MTSRSLMNDIHLVDDTDEPNVGNLGSESGGSVPTTNSNVVVEGETNTNSTKTTAKSEKAKVPRKRMQPRSKVWTEGIFTAIKDGAGNIIKDMYGGEESENVLELERVIHMEDDNDYVIDNLDNDLEYQANNKATGAEIADNVKRAMEDLFNEYKRKFTIQESGTSTSSSMSSQVVNATKSQNTKRLANKYKRRRTGGVLGVGDKSELDKYLNEDLEETGDKFDILGWWKINSARFIILARIARDVLSIPVSIVASESAFSTGGKFLMHLGVHCLLIRWKLSYVLKIGLE